MPSDNEILKVIADNPALYQAVKELLLKKFEGDSVLSSTMTDEQIGQITRARIAGIDKVNAAFEEIARHKTTKPLPEKENPAR